MEQVLTGLIGVIAGAIVTGGAQAYRLWADRQLAGRTAARLIRAAVDETRSAVHTIRVGPQTSTWSDFVFDWNRANATWAEHRKALAQMTSATDFRRLTGFFLIVDTLARCRDAQLKLEPHQREKPPTPLMDRVDGAADIVEPVLDYASRSRTERRREQKRISP